MPTPALIPLAGDPDRPTPAVGAPNGSARRSRWEVALVVAAMATVIWFYHWTVALNGGFNDWGELDYYRLLVRGWMKGHLYIDIAPKPELLALADPYDPAQNQPYKMGDVSLYRGRYYIYFGVAPALTLLAPYALLTGREMTMGAGAFVFATLAFLAASGLALAVRRRYFPGSAVWTAPLGVLALGFGTHLLALAQRPMFWELPIAAGIAFTLLAVWATYAAMHGRRPILAMSGAGLALGLAVASRPPCLVAAPLLLAPIWLAWRERHAAGGVAPRSPRLWWQMAVAAALPLGACGLALMAHNYARFDNPLEWGQTYQLTGAYEAKLTHFSLRFLPHNFAVYFFQLPEWTAEFPFVLTKGIEVHDIPDYFGTEEVAGLAVMFPFFSLLLALPLAWWRRPAGEARQLAAIVGGMAGYTVPVMVLMLCWFSTCTRYQTDFAVGLAWLAVIGMLGLERWARLTAPLARRGGRTGIRVLCGAAMLLCVGTVPVGVLASFDYHGRWLKIAAPMKWSEIYENANRGLAELGHTLGCTTGPRVLKVRFQPRPMGTVETFWRAQDPRADERIVIEHIGDPLIRFGYARGSAAIIWGRPLRWETGHTHTVSVQLPSLYPPAGGNWWSSGRVRDEFRERRSAAVWFSGGRALDTAVKTLPAGITPGGAVGADFSGEVRKITTRLYRADEVNFGLADHWAPRGGILRLRVIFHDVLPEEGEPLFAAGAHYRSSIVFVQPAPGGLKFVFENYTLPRIESAVFQPHPDGHVVELEMASFNPDAYGVEAEGDVVIRLDGREMMRTCQVGYPFPWGHERIGSNPFGTTCALEFRGWILDGVWVRQK